MVLKRYLIKKDEQFQALDTAVPPDDTSDVPAWLSFYAALIRRITGKPSFLTAPAMDLEAVNTLLNDHSERHREGAADAIPVATQAVGGLESAADKTKLDGIETGATADQTAAEILAALLGVDGSGSGLDADLLDGFDAAAFLRLAGGTMTGALTLSGDPTQALHAVTMQYVDAARAGLDLKPSVRAATSANVALATGGLITVDGVTLAAGDRVLVKAQTNAAENGIYVAAAGAWTRAPDSDAGPEVTPGAFVFVEEGTVGADTGWVLATNGPISLGTTALTFTQFSGPGSTVAGTGLLRSGNALSADFGTGAGKVTQGNDGRLSDPRTPTDDSVTASKMSQTNRGTIICTSTTRPTGTDAPEGQHIYETDTDATLKNTGTPAAPVWSALGGSTSQATEAAAGIAEIATSAELDAGTDDMRIVTPTKAYRMRRPVYAYPSPGFAAYNVSLAATTWTRLTNPKHTISALGTPPPGTKWVVFITGFLRLAAGPAATVYMGAAVNLGAMGSVHGGGVKTNTGDSMFPFSASVGAPSDNSASFTVDYAIYVTAAGTYNIDGNPGPLIEIKAVQL